MTYCNEHLQAKCGQKCIPWATLTLYGLHEKIVFSLFMGRLLGWRVNMRRGGDEWDWGV